MTTLVKNPIYHQLHTLLRQEVARGTYATGAKFLTEREIGQRYEVSRATANKVLSSLVAEGVLEFRKGIGTFVRPQVLEYDLRRLVSFTEKASAAGKRPETKVLTFQKCDTAGLAERLAAAKLANIEAAAVTQRLGLEPADTAWWLERLRLADGAPVILERRAIVARHCPSLKRSDVAGSLYQVWAERLQLPIAGADEVIRAVNVDRADARLLDVKPQSAGLLVTAVGLLEGDRPLWWEQTLYRADAYEFHNRLGGAGLRPAVGRLTTDNDKPKENR